MIFYHFTSAENLDGIGRFGLTVGDVPTDLRTGRGRCGVWLTTSPQPAGHGLQTSATDKQRYRLSVDVQTDDSRLHRWADWAAIHVTADTRDALHRTADTDGTSWMLYLGVLPPGQIVSCTDLQTGATVDNWRAIKPDSGKPSPGVPAWRRTAWHKALLKRVDRAYARHAAGG